MDSGHRALSESTRWGSIRRVQFLCTADLESPPPPSSGGGGGGGGGGGTVPPPSVISTPTAANTAISSDVLCCSFDDVFPSKLTGKALFSLSTAAAGSKLDDIVSLLHKFLGDKFLASKPRQPGSDLILQSVDKAKQVRFDITNPHGLPPHVNIETFELRNRYPGDTRMNQGLNIHVFPKQ